MADTKPLKVGQRWTFKTHYFCNSTLLIGEIEKRASANTLVHVAIENPQGETPSNEMAIGHMPFIYEALEDSVLELRDENVLPEQGFQQGLELWRKQKGGAFDVAVQDAIDGVLGSIPEEDACDRLVKRMRALNTQSAVDALYAHLFSLERWFFLCMPNDSRAPVEWVFPEGQNKAPALLAFTDEKSAANAAVQLQIYDAGEAVSIMPAKVSDAVRWLISDQCVNTWVCFNLTQENFPLYCDDAERLLLRFGHAS